MSEKYLDNNGTQILINQIKGNCTLKVSTLPTASADELGKIYQYIGTTSGNLIHNYFYECVSDGVVAPTYTWQNVNVQPTAGTPTAATTTFDNTTSGLQATNVQDAIDEVEGRVDNIEEKIPSTATSSNKLVDHDSLGTAAFKNSTDRVSPNNTALVESQSVYSAINTALSSIYTPRGDITCAELTSDLLIAANVGNIYETSDSGTTSALFLQGAGVPIATGSNVGIINAGQGRILFNLMANAFDLTDYQKKDLANTIEGATTVEGALGALSTNKATQAEVNDIVNVLGAKNLLPSIKASKTVGDVTFTLNGDGSITANGTASNTIYVDLVTSQSFLGQGNYVLSGGVNANQFIYVNTLDSGTYIDTIARAEGEDAVFSINYSGYNQLTVGISITSGQSVDHVTFYPMIRLASDPDNTYAPYAMTNQQLTADTEALTNNINVNGSKNVLTSLTPSGTYLGITISRNESGDIVVNGTATTSPTTISLFDRTFKHIGEATILRFTDLGIDKTKKYVFSRAEKVSNLRYNIRVMNGTTQVAEIELGNNDGLYTVIDFSQYTCDGLKADIVVTNGTTITNKVFSAMLCLESDYDLDPTYQPYAKTNRELTKKIDIVGNLFTTTTKVVDNITHGIATTIATLENLPIGIYVVSGQFNSDSAMSGGGLIQFVSSGVIQNGASCNTMINQGFKANAGLTGIFNVTNATNQINLQIYTANADLTVVSVKLAAIRIA